MTSESSESDKEALPGRSLDIILPIFGTRGDVQPYLRIAKILQDTYGHRVRLVASPESEKLVRGEHGLDFYSARHSLAPLIDFDQLSTGAQILATLNGGFSRIKRLQGDLFDAHWEAAVDQDNDGSGPSRPFVADAIMAPPTSMTHFSIAQCLGIPLFMLGAGPRSRTRLWPHNNYPKHETMFQDCDKNYRTWVEVEEQSWKLYYRPIINKFRRKLGLPVLSRQFWPLQFEELGVPLSYLISPSVLPKPKDWPAETNMLGYSFEPDRDNSFTPPEDLVSFLARPGTKIYVDFASNRYTGIDRLGALLIEATQDLDVLVVVRKAWFKTNSTPPPHIFVVEEVPHFWLFPQVDLIVQSCGAGMVGASLYHGKPSVAVPIRVDQHLWAKRLELLGAAPPALKMTQLTASSLAAAIQEGLRPERRLAASNVSESVRLEGCGAKAAVGLWQAHMARSHGYPPPCALLSGRSAVWAVRARPDIRLSALAAYILCEEKLVRLDELDLVRSVEWDALWAITGSSETERGPPGAVRDARVAQGRFDLRDANAGGDSQAGDADVTDRVVQSWRALSRA